MRGAWAALSRDLAVAMDHVAADVVHCHTWYSHLAGMLYGRPMASPCPSPCTRSSRCVRGSANSWAAATTSRPGSSARHWRWQTPSSPSAGHPSRCTAPVRRQSGASPRHPQRDRPDLDQPGPPPTSWRAMASTRARPSCCSSAASRDRRASSTWSGPSRDRPGRFGRAVCRRAGHPGDRARDGGRSARRRRRTSWHHLDSGDAAARRRPSSSIRMPPCSVPIDLRAVRDHQPGGHGL